MITLFKWLYYIATASTVILIIIATIFFIKEKEKKHIYKLLTGAIGSFVCMVLLIGVTSSQTMINGNKVSSTTQQANTLDSKAEQASTNVNKEEPTTQQTEEKKKNVYTLGDTINISTKEGDYNLRIDKIMETSDRNRFSDKKADRVVIIDYSYENISQEENLYIFDSHFKAYDKGGNSLETYPVSTKSPEQISIGRKTSGQMAFALNDTNNYIELEFYDNMFASKRDCLITLEW